ncbi:MAG: hypothetical protein IPM98_11340 [Lewinellaceae bacterium]|nr:hypothetical protein [Lewinellaceae bacterium]
MNEQVSFKRKTFIFSVLFLLLVVLPAGSWFYLRGGLNWRKQAQAELQNYGKIRSAQIIYADGTKENMLAEKVCVVYYFGANPDLTEVNRKILDTGERLFTQFGYKSGNQYDDFRLVMITQGGTAEFRTHAQTLPSADFANWVWTGGLGSWRTILVNAYDLYCQKNKVEPVEHYFALTDTTGTIRRFYNAVDEKELGRMVEHIALLLPTR